MMMQDHIAPLESAVTYLRRGKTPQYAEQGSVQIINQKCVRWNGVDTSQTRPLSDAHRKNWSHEHYLQPGDILINSTGEGTIGRAAIWDKDGNVYVADSHVTVIRTNRAKLEPWWLRYWIESPDGQAFVSSSKTGGTKQTELGAGKLRQADIPLPPVTEQRRIVARIKACMERIDEIEGLRTQTRKESDILELASFHDALLNGIEQQGWPVGKLGDVALSFKYGTSAKAHSDEVGTTVLRMGNIANGYLDFSALKFIELPARELNKYRLKVGDILINRTNSLELVGKAAMFDREDGEWVYASYLVCVEVDRTRILPEFVTAVLNSRMGRDFVAATARRAIGMVNINAKEMARFPMPLPSLKDQEVAVERLRAVRASAQSLRAELSEPGVAHLRSSVLRKAFAGEL